MTQVVTSAEPGVTDDADEPLESSVSPVPGAPAKKLPVIEIFGPTIQGEGPLSGTRTLFLRLGLCDYRCSWCDSMHAVLPEKVKANAEYVDQVTLAQQLVTMHQKVGAPWVTISGGNPLVHNCQHLVDALQEGGLKVAVETQGSLFKEWLKDCDQVVISPKPPSSGMRPNLPALNAMVTQLMMANTPFCFKVVIMGKQDFTWARWLHDLFLLEWGTPLAFPFYLSVGNPDLKEYGDKTVDQMHHRDLLCNRLRQLYEWTLEVPELGDVIVGPQMHVLAWGNKQGV